MLWDLCNPRRIRVCVYCTQKYIIEVRLAHLKILFHRTYIHTFIHILSIRSLEKTHQGDVVCEKKGEFLPNELG